MGSQTDLITAFKCQKGDCGPLSAVSESLFWSLPCEGLMTSQNCFHYPVFTSLMKIVDSLCIHSKASFWLPKFLSYFFGYQKTVWTSNFEEWSFILVRLFNGKGLFWTEPLYYSPPNWKFQLDFKWPNFESSGTSSEVFKRPLFYRVCNWTR